MDEREKPDRSAASEAAYEVSIGSIDPESAEFRSREGAYVQQEFKEAPPTFYVMLLWQRAFCDLAFNDNWWFVLQNDPYFGDGRDTHGHLARFMPERSVRIFTQANQLMNGGWKDTDRFPQFKKYKKAVAAFPDIWTTSRSIS